MGQGCRRATIATGLALLLTACGNDLKAPNEANFTHAIDASLEKPGAGIVCLADVPQLPGEVSEQFRASVADSEKRYAPFMQAGLVAERTVHRTQPTYFGKPVTIAVREYALTPLGSAHATKRMGFMQVSNTFCYASYRVGKVVNFTEPGDVMGMQVTQVRWTPRILAVADWAKDAKVTRALPAIEQTLAATTAQEKTTMLDLTNSGWEVAR
jgi:hypothetical protein